ncbi:unnamed protein product [Blepharisma stoltei]|uniref:Uncharacterized protein n=1 Tax=Blepharisma stoltei TaxID=1481888 RepID=A0AAU9IF96_9CILI|nr:unnamed protein product [Blepharisma stoltei]
MKKETEESLWYDTPLANTDMKLNKIVNPSELPIKRLPNQKDDPSPNKHLKQYNSFEYSEVEQKSVFNYFNFIGKANKELKAIFHSNPQMKAKACQYKNWSTITMYLKEQLNMNQRYNIDELNNQKIMIDNAISFFKKILQDNSLCEPTKKEDVVNQGVDWKTEFNSACERILNLSVENKQNLKSLIIGTKQSYNKIRERILVPSSDLNKQKS